MANLIRSAKAGSDWTLDDLRAFNTQVVPQNAFSFFGLQDLPIPQNISPIIWNNVAPPPGVRLSKVEYNFFAYLKNATQVPPELKEGSMFDFAAFLLDMLDYNDGPRLIQTRTKMPFYMCGTRVDAVADITVIELDSFRPQPCSGEVVYALIHKLYQPGDKPEATLIAEAIAAFHQNNRARDIMDLPPFKSQMFPAITMAGTAVIFYKIKITRDLSLAAEDGASTTNATIIHRFVPPVPDILSYSSMGMIPLENRRIILQCLEASKQLLGNAPA